MKLCEDGHDEVCYESEYCPVCEIKDEMTRYQDEVEKLNDTINKLNFELRSYEEG